MHPSYTGFNAFACLAALIVAIAFAGDAAAQSTDQRVVVQPGKRTGPPWLGVMLGKGAEGADGVPVTAVMRGSPADGTGIRVGDAVVEIAGRKVQGLRDVRRVVRSHRIGETVPVVVLRDGASQTLKFTLDGMPDSETLVRRHLVGRPAPDFAFQYVGDGKKTSLSSLKGKPTVIDFWATWCGPCHRLQDDLAAVKKKYGDKINIVGVSSESASTIRAFLARKPAHYAMASDVEGKGHASYAVSSFPMVVILDADQRVASVAFGASAAPVIDRKLANLLGE
jgi:thiol-disulfide isomerase/thioredoxin